MKKTTASVVLAAFLVGSAGLMAGCKKDGPAENAGEKLEDTAQKLEDKIDPPGPLEKAGRKVDDAFDKD